jgi:tripartite-type tricarboxylate transporter receptor subunit TctC
MTNPARACIAVLLGLCISAASAQDYPNKLVRIYSNSPPGVNDFLARVVAQQLSAPLGQPVVIDNRPGNIIPAEIVAKSPPDGYSLLSHGIPLYTIPMMQKVSFEPFRDFTPIAWVSSSPLVIAVPPSLGVDSVKDLIALAKAKPGELNYASTSTGGTIHLATELFKSMTGTSMTHIPYKAPGPVITDLLTGRVQVFFAVPNSVVPHAKSGKLKLLAVTSAVPSDLLPGVPTVAASGVPGFESAGLYGMFGPARMPEAIVRRLSTEIVRVMKTEEARKRMHDFGLEPVAGTSDEFAAKLKSEAARIGKVIKDANIRID